MTKWVTKIDKAGAVILSEKYTDGKEKFDDGPKMVPGEVKAESRARLLGSQLADGERVIVSDEEYDPVLFEGKEIKDEE